MTAVRGAGGSTMKMHEKWEKIRRQKREEKRRPDREKIDCRARDVCLTPGMVEQKRHRKPPSPRRRRHNKKEQAAARSLLKNRIRTEKIERPHPTFRLVKDARYGAADRT